MRAACLAMSSVFSYALFQSGRHSGRGRQRSRPERWDAIWGNWRIASTDQAEAFHSPDVWAREVAVL